MHSIGVGLLARKDQIHFFDQIGYEHAPFMHCPRDSGFRDAAQCSCLSWYSFGVLSRILWQSFAIKLTSSDLTADYQGYSCMPQWDRIHN